MIGFSDLEKSNEPSWFEKNKKMLMTGGTLLGVAIVGYFVYTKFMVKSGYSAGGGISSDTVDSSMINME